MTHRPCSVHLAALLSLLASPLLHAADPAPTTKPTTTEIPALTERQASLLLQLADAEANIKTINQALVRTGYKVSLAYDRVDANQKGNELMDRKGGAPVPWEQFYGKTAEDFYHHGSADLRYDRGKGNTSLDLKWTGSRLTKLERPKQFDAIYRANNQQIDRAKQQIETLQKDQAALLARRQKHEADQGRLWAVFAWEQVKDREIPFRPLYRFALQPADGAEARVLRPAVCFLRTIDAAIGAGLESLPSDQAGTFTDLQQRTRAAYAALQQSLADALLAPQLKHDQKTRADALKALCKQATDQCTVIADNYAKAMESERAKEDGSKLEFRGQLQSSLARLAATTAELDNLITAVAEAWHVTPLVGTANPDPLPTFAARPAPAATAAVPPAAATAAAAADATTAKPPAPKPGLFEDAPPNRSISSVLLPPVTRNVMLFHSVDNDERLMREVSQQKLRVVDAPDVAARLADPGSFTDISIVAFGPNRWRDLKPADFTPAVRQNLQQFVRNGGDLLLFEQADQGNMDVFEAMFGINTRDAYVGAKIFNPALAAKAKAAGITDEAFDQVACSDSFWNLPKGSLVLVRSRMRNAAAVAPYGNGRLILIGLSVEPPADTLDELILALLYDDKQAKEPGSTAVRVPPPANDGTNRKVAYDIDFDQLATLVAAGEKKGPASGTDRPRGSVVSPPSPGLLIGLSYTTTSFEGRSVIKTLSATFITAEGKHTSRTYGTFGKMKEPKTVIARPGYVVGAVVTDCTDRLNGFKLVFMRVHGTSLDATDSYESEWIGGKAAESQDKLAGDGRPVTGVQIHFGSEINALGLMQPK